MSMIRIEGVDDILMDRLRLLAELNGCTVEQEALALLKAAAGSSGRFFSPEERLAEADRIRAMTPKGVAQTDSTEIIRDLRDGGYAGR